jgi:hypothetical protein
MRHQRLLAIVFCLVCVFGLAPNAGAWTWSGFSGLCVKDTLRGAEGETIEFTLQNVTVYTQCYNIQGGVEGQPGIGNLGLLTLSLDTEPSPDKVKGVVTVAGCISLRIFDEHDHPDHIHTCYPLDNKNKIEQEGSAWIADFVADWTWYDDKGKLINWGTDECYWLGGLNEFGYPDHEASFECTSTSNKKINWVSQ